MRMMHKVLVLASLLFSSALGMLLVVPNIVFAAQLYTQTVDNSNSGYIGYNGSQMRVLYQQLGNSLTGQLDRVEVKVDVASGGTGSQYIYMDLCTNASQVSNWSANTCTPVAGASSVQMTIPTTPGTYTWTIDLNSAPVTLDPSLYYYIFLRSQSQTFGDLVRVKGASSNQWSGGSCVGTYTGAVDACGSLADIYFYLGGAQTISNVSSVSNLKPANASTTSSTNVNVGFSYYVYADNDVTGYAMLFVDRTAGTSFTLTGSVVGSGAGSISRFVNLNSGHQYKMSVALTDSSGGTYGGAATTFSVVATGTPLAIYQASTTINYDTNGSIATGTGAFATSSIYYSGTNFSLTNIFPTQLDDALRSRFPFSYVYDAAVLFEELGGGSATTTNASFTFPLGAQTSTGSTTFTLIDKSAIASIPAVASIREMMSNIIYFTTAIYIIGAVMAAF